MNLRKYENASKTLDQMKDLTTSKKNMAKVLFNGIFVESMIDINLALETLEEQIMGTYFTCLNSKEQSDCLLLYFVFFFLRSL